MTPFAILIDGAWAKKALNPPSSPFGSDTVRSLVEWVREKPIFSGCRLHRAYFYDAPPFQGKRKNPLSGEEFDFSSTTVAQRNTRFLDEVCRLPFTSARLGEVNFVGWKFPINKAGKGEDGSFIGEVRAFKPDFRQKGVDMRLGLDVASLTLKGHAKILALVAGDSDFVPAMKFARREGAQVVLFTLGRRVTPNVTEHSDLVFDDVPPPPAR